MQLSHLSNVTMLIYITSRANSCVNPPSTNVEAITLKLSGGGRVELQLLKFGKPNLRNFGGRCVKVFDQGNQSVALIFEILIQNAAKSFPIFHILAFYFVQTYILRQIVHFNSRTFRISIIQTLEAYQNTNFNIILVFTSF